MSVNVISKCKVDVFRLTVYSLSYCIRFRNFSQMLQCVLQRSAIVRPYIMLSVVCLSSSSVMGVYCDKTIKARITTLLAIRSGRLGQGRCIGLVESVILHDTL